MGWVYQFWQARKKKQVNDSEVKIGADELPAVTQLFTEPYMVSFLLQNTLGAWWVGAGRTLSVEMPYLRRLEDGSPAAGAFEGWPKTTRELKVLDPCCGSGHFLVAAFEILISFRIAEERLSARDACDVVLRENLFGLELDNRCVQIAAFALALAAWTHPDAGGYRSLPPMNLACSGLSVAPMPWADETDEEQARRLEETNRLRDKWGRQGKNLRQQRGMGHLFDLFVNAPVLGSLIDPTRDMPEPLLCASAEELRPLLERVLNEESSELEAEEHESHVAARGITEAARLLGEKYHLIATNVPYLAQSKQSQIIQMHCSRYLSDAKQDLATSFFERLINLAGPGGSVVAVLPHNSLFLTSYRKFRGRILSDTTIDFVVALGPAAFRDMNWWAIKTMLLGITVAQHSKDQTFIGIDLKDHRDTSEKHLLLRTYPVAELSQSEQLLNPDSRIVLEHTSGGALLGSYGDAYAGQRTGDAPRFTMCYWESASIQHGWVRFATTVEPTMFDGGNHHILLWEEGTGKLAKFQADLAESAYASGGWKQGWQAWGKRGIRVSQMGRLPVSLHRGEHFDNNCAVIVPKQQSYLPAIWAFCSSQEYATAVRKIDNALKVTNSTLVKIPFDLDHWQKVADEKYPNGLPEPYSEDPTQWLFKGKVTPSDAPLQVAIARLIGYRWPDQEPDALDGLVDADGILCIPPVAGETPAAERLRDLLRAAYGGAWSPPIEQKLLSGLGFSGRTLEDWLRNGFFKQHCELFHHRPFIWHIGDGLREGFAALVNYHRLDHKGLESLTFRYLGDWIKVQKDAVRNEVPGSPERLRKAEELQSKLKLILDGEDPYDIFVRWKPLEQQPVGWNPDLNDGVRLNIRPFMQAGVLAWKPNIKWGTDRGKNPPGAPWGEERDNDRHLTLEQKGK